LRSNRSSRSKRFERFERLELFLLSQLSEKPVAVELGDDAAIHELGSPLVLEQWISKSDAL
jgi:hypothetical protein